MSEHHLRFSLIATALTALTAAAITPLARLQPNAPSLSAERLGARDRMIEKLRTKQMKPFDRPDGALEFYWAKRSPTGEALSVTELQEAMAEAAQLPLHTTVGRSGAGSHHNLRAFAGPLVNGLAGAWQPHGPGNIGGRSRALLIHRTQNNLMWTAGVAGGIWKSTDGGASWQPKGDLLVNIAVNSLIEDPAQDNVLYAGTGEGFFNADSVRGQGIFKSTDYGETWTQLASTDNSEFLLRAEARGHAPQDEAAHLRRDADGRLPLDRRRRDLDEVARRNGGQWLHGPGDSVLPGGQGTCRTTCLPPAARSRRRTVWRALDVDAGQVWEPVLSEPTMGRTSLAIAPSNPSVVYALASYYNLTAADPQRPRACSPSIARPPTAPPAPGKTRVHYTDPNKLNTVQLTNPVYAFLRRLRLRPGESVLQPRAGTTTRSPSIPRTRTSSGPRASIRCGPTTAARTGVWRATGGSTPAIRTTRTPTTTPSRSTRSTTATATGRCSSASDGGIHRTDDARAAVGTTLAQVCGEPTPGQVTWTSLNNGYQVTQFYHGAVYPDGQTLLRRHAGQRHAARHRRGGQNWGMIRGGDGGYVAVNQDEHEHPLRRVHRQEPASARSTAARTGQPIHGGVGEAAGNYQFIHPFAMDPSNSSPTVVWRRDRLSQRQRRLRRGRARATVLASRIASWGIAPSDRQPGLRRRATPRHDDIRPHLHDRTTATTPQPARTGVAGQRSRARATSRRWRSIRSNPLVAYATYSTYNFGTHVGHVFKTSDGGATWTPHRRDAARHAGALGRRAPDAAEHALHRHRPRRVCHDRRRRHMDAREHRLCQRGHRAPRDQQRPAVRVHARPKRLEHRPGIAAVGSCQSALSMLMPP